MIVYDFPTVQLLTTWVQAASSDSLEFKTLKDIDTRVAAMQALADKYSPLQFPNSHIPHNEHVTSGGAEAKHLPRVILITGTTGSLGCHMLHQLAQDTSVARIYAIGRASDVKHLRERQHSALEGRGLSGSLLKDPRIVLIPAETLDDVPDDILQEVIVP